MSRDELAYVIADAIWGPVVCSPDQMEECYRIADAITAAGYEHGEAVMSGPGPIGGQSGPASSSPIPRCFELVRYRDLSGVSGTGVVAEGCLFTDGSVALRWRGDHPATAVWADLESVLAVHGHQGATVPRWLRRLDRPVASKGGKP